MSLKKRANRGETDKAKAAFAKMAPRKLKNKERNKLNKTLWETTQGSIDKEDIEDWTDEDDDSDEDENIDAAKDETAIDQNAQ